MSEDPAAARRPDTLSKRDPRPIPEGRGEIRCFATMQDEALRLPWFLDHHRRLGVDRFFIIDNASGDGTEAVLLAQPDVHCFHVAGSYRDARFGLTWLNTLLDAFGDGRWCLTIDADELLVYPESETIGLRGLTEHLDAQGARALFSIMIEMYGPGPIRDTRYEPGTPLIAACPLFDPGPYVTRRAGTWPFFEVHGGTRERVFWSGDVANPLPPKLSKLPLMRWGKGMRYVSSTHSLMAPVPLGDLRAALLHFKFLHDFPRRCAALVARNQHYGDSREYRRYLEVIEAQPDLALAYPGSLRYEGSRQLVDIGILMSSDAYRRFAAARA